MARVDRDRRYLSWKLMIILGVLMLILFSAAMIWGKYDHNSYMSNDDVNNIDWSVLKVGTNEYNMMQYYKGLMAMRAAYSIFRSDGNVAVTFKDLPGGGMVVTFDDHMGGYAMAIINPTSEAVTYTLNGEWQLIATDTQAGSEVIATESGDVTINAFGVRIYVK